MRSFFACIGHVNVGEDREIVASFHPFMLHHNYIPPSDMRSHAIHLIGLIVRGSAAYEKQARLRQGCSHSKAINVGRASPGRLEIGSYDGSLYGTRRGALNSVSYMNIVNGA